MPWFDFGFFDPNDPVQALQFGFDNIYSDPGPTTSTPTVNIGNDFGDPSSPSSGNDFGGTSSPSGGVDSLG